MKSETLAMIIIGLMTLMAYAVSVAHDITEGIAIAKLKFISIFAIAILVSFIPEAFPDFFGDWSCQGGSYVMRDGHYHSVGCLYSGNYQHNPTTHWGFRHWMWTLCGVSLFIWNVVELFPKKLKL